MNISNAPLSQVTDPSKARRKRWAVVIIAFCTVILLCVLTFCALGVSGIVEGAKPKTNLAFYQDASIAHMLDACEPERYFSWMDWMVPVPGDDMVMAMNYSKFSPAPDAFYGYTLYIQIDPALMAVSQELSLPGQGVQPFLLETRAPYVVCTSDLTGTVKILEADNNTLRARLDVNSIIDGNNWEFKGEVEFKQAPLPK